MLFILSVAKIVTSNPHPMFTCLVPEHGGVSFLTHRCTQKIAGASPSAIVYKPSQAQSVYFSIPDFFFVFLKDADVLGSQQSKVILNFSVLPVGS